jgi:hypothetical protein
MKEPRFGIADVIISVMLFVLIVMMFVLSVGCASTCPPAKTEIVPVEVPVYACPEVPQPPQLVLPEPPLAPPMGADAESLKDWYASLPSWVKARHKILLDLIQYLEDILEQYRATPE